MNRTLILLGIFGLVGIMVVGVVLIAILRPDANATVIAFSGTTLATMINAVVLFYGLNRANEKIDRVEKQTNGINTALLSKVTDMSEDTIERHKGTKGV